MPAGRKPKPANMIDNDVSHYSNEDIQQRIDAEPRYFKQEFKCPYGLSELEQNLWAETTEIFKEMKNCQICDADSRAIQTYVEWLAIGIESKANWIKNGKRITHLVEVGTDKNGLPKFERQKDNDYQMMFDSAIVCEKYRKNLYLDVFSRIKAGSTTIIAKKEEDLFSKLMGRKSD